MSAKEFHARYADALTRNNKMKPPSSQISTEFADVSMNYMLARASADRIAAYVSRGRSLGHLTLARLQEAFKTTFRDYLRSGLRRRDDAEAAAEFELRAKEPSFHALRPDIDTLTSQALVQLRRDRTTGGRIGKSLIHDYLECLARRQ